MGKFILMAGVALMTAASPLLAKDKGHAKGHGNGHGYSNSLGKGDRDASRLIRADRDDVGRANRARFGGRSCPPGLAKKSPACVPPGQAKKRSTEGRSQSQLMSQIGNILK